MSNLPKNFRLTYFQLTDNSGSIIGYKQLLKMINYHLVLT